MATKWTVDSAVKAARGWYHIQRQVDRLNDPHHAKLTPMSLLFPEDLGHFALAIDFAEFDKVVDAATWLVKEGHADMLIDVPGTLALTGAQGGEACAVLDAAMYQKPRIEQLRAKADAYLKSEAERNAYYASHCSHTDRLNCARETERKRKAREAKRALAKEHIAQLQTQIKTDFADDAADDDEAA